MSLTPQQIREKIFTSTQLRRGYDEQEVDDFLDEAAAAITELTRDNATLRQGPDITGLLVLAQKTHDQHVAAAVMAKDKMIAQAEALLREAKERSRGIVTLAEQERDGLRHEIKHLKAGKADIQTGLRLYLEAQLVALASTATD